MKRAVSLSFFLVAVAVLLLAQGLGPSFKPKTFSFTGDIGPQLIPTSPTAVSFANQDGSTTTTATVYVTGLTLSNESTVADTCKIVDNQAAPRVIYWDSVGGRGTGNASLFIMVFPDPISRKSPGGVTWSCTNGTVAGYMTYER